MIRTPSILLVLASLALAALWSKAFADEGKGGLPAPDPQAKARLSVRWNAPPDWRALEAREGEFAAYRLQRTRKEDQGEVTEEGPRLVIHYLGKLNERRQVQRRRAAWARRFLSPERKRLLPEAAKLRPLRKEVDPALAIHLVEVRGDYSAVLAPGQEPRPPRRDWTGLYAHVVAPDGVWVAVLLGPTKITQAWSGALQELLQASKAGTVMIRPDPRERGRTPRSAPASSPTPTAEKATPAGKTSSTDEDGGR